MSDYYTNNLSAGRLKRVYDIAPSRVKQFLKAEIDYILNKIKQDDSVLELGCGYGRVLKELYVKTSNLTGIDISNENIQFGISEYLSSDIAKMYTMDAISLDFPSCQFDIVLCIQNGISAFKINPELLVKKALRVTKPGGIFIMSSYSDKFWKTRLEWFNLQAKEGLLGEIDYDLTGDGIICCKDGFRATTFGHRDFANLLSNMNLDFKISEVDNSLIFCEIMV